MVFNTPEKMLFRFDTIVGSVIFESLSTLTIPLQILAITNVINKLSKVLLFL